MGSVPGKTTETNKQTSRDNKKPHKTDDNSENHQKLKQAVDNRKYSFMDGFKQDPRCPLTERELYTLNKSWKAVNREITTTAVNMFVRLFETNKDLQVYFPQFFEIPTVAELRAHKAFQAHAVAVVCAIDDVIANLDDMDYVVAMVGAVVDTHALKFDSFNFDSVWRVKEPLVMAVRETLGDRFTISVQAVYVKTVDFLLTAIQTAGNQRNAAIQTAGNQHNAAVQTAGNQHNTAVQAAGNQHNTAVHAEGNQQSSDTRDNNSSQSDKNIEMTDAD